MKYHLLYAYFVCAVPQNLPYIANYYQDHHIQVIFTKCELFHTTIWHLEYELEFRSIRNHRIDRARMQH